MRPLLSLAVALTACHEPCDRPGSICTIAGVPGEAGFGPDDELATASPLYDPEDVAVGPDGTVYIADDNNHAIRAIDQEGVLHIVAGGAFLGDGPEGPARESSFNHPASLAVDPVDPNFIWIAATGNHRIKLLDLAAEMVSVVAGTGEPGFVGEGSNAAFAELNRPTSVAVALDGRRYVSDKLNQVVRCIQPDDTIVTYAGQPERRGYAGDGGLALDAMLHAPEGQEYDPGNRVALGNGALWVADTGNHVIRRIDLLTEIITTVAGRAAPGYDAGVTGALDTRLNLPHDIAMGPQGQLYIADTGNHCIRVLQLDGTLEDFAGTCGSSGFAGDGGEATSAMLNAPAGVGVDAEGNVYIADTENHVVRRVIVPR